MSPTEYRLAAILSTDIAGFSRLMESNESESLELLRVQSTLVRVAVESHGGRVIRTSGETVLAEFSNTADATRSAIEIQQAVARHNRESTGLSFQSRIGVHLGDTHFLDDDAVGDGVTIASQLQAAARPGRICISGDVYNIVSRKIEFRTTSLGVIPLKDRTPGIAAYEIDVEQTADPLSDYKTVKTMVLREIKAAGRRISLAEMQSRLPDRSAAVDAILETLADQRFLTRAVPTGPNRPHMVEITTPGGTFKPADLRAEHFRRQPGQPHRVRPPVPQETPDSQGDSWDQALAADNSGSDTLVEDYKDHAANAAEKEKAGFRGHLLSFIGVNAGLFFLWSATMFGGFPWFLIVALGWGIGLASHYSGVRDKVRETRELDGFPGLTRDQLRIYRKLAKARNAFTSHLVSNAATSVFLLLLNLMVSPGFLWAAFPVGFMAIGVLTHLPAFKSKERRLLKRLQAAGASIAHLVRGKKARIAAAQTPVTHVSDGPSRDAEATRARIVAALERLPDGSPIGEEFVPVLDSYVEQIQLLDRKNRELDVIMKDIPLTELDRDLVSLRRKRDAASDDSVIAEYNKHIGQIEKQQGSYRQLRNDHEILRLRLSSSLNQLKQMEIDLARMKNISGESEEAAFSMLKEKATELSRYLDDLQEGYRELE